MMKYVECKSRGMTLRGMMHLPEGKGPFPFAIILHGLYDDGPEINYVHTELSRRLEKEGIGSVRFDFAGCGNSDGEHENMTISGEAADACAMLDWLKKQPFADPARIALHGLSLGGCVASMAAGMRHDEVAALSLWCPAPDVVTHMREKMVCNVPVPDIDKTYGDIEGLKLGRGFYEDCCRIDPFAIASAFGGPVNLVHGDADIVASWHCSERYKEIFGDKARLTIIHGAGHHFESVAWREARMVSAIDFLKETLLGE